MLKRVLLRTQTALETVQHEIDAANGILDEDREQDLGSNDTDADEEDKVCCCMISELLKLPERTRMSVICPSVFRSKPVSVMVKVTTGPQFP